MTIATNSFSILIPALITYFLAKRTYKHEVIFRKFHETRAEVIQQIWAKIITLGPSLRIRAFCNLIPAPEFEKALQDCSCYWITNKIFLDEKTNEVINQFLDKIDSAYGEQQRVKKIEGREHEDIEARKDCNKNFKTIVYREIPPLEKYLEMEFKKIIGADDWRRKASKYFTRLFS